MPAAEPNPSTLQEVSSAAYPSLERKPGKQNWVDKAGGLPSYIERIAKHLHYEKGKDIGAAIAIAVNTVKRWATGTNHNGSKLKPATVAKAQKAVSEWEAKKGKSKLKEALIEDDDLVLSKAEIASLVGAFTHRLTLVEGMAIGLKGKGTARRAGRVAGALALSEGREAKMVLDSGTADSRDLARAQSMLGSEIAELRILLEAFGAAPVIPRSPAGPTPQRRGKKPPQAKGRNGQAVFDESKHPRAAKGRVGGGQFIRAGNKGPEVKGIQRSLGAKPDGKFGRETKKKVEAFQQAKGLTKDGVVGGQTAAALIGAKGIPGPLLSHHRANLRAAKKRFTPEATANADAQEKRENKARKARKEAQDDAKSSSSSSDTDSSSEGGAGSTFGEGSSLPGKIAELIQRKLGIETTGAYDERTKERIEEFQKANGLEVDGIVGTQTLAALRGDESPPAPGAFTEADWTWLSSNQAGGGENRKEARKDAVPKPISSPAEDSLPEEKTKKLAEDGWDYHDGKWWPPGHPRNLREAIEQDDFHRKYGAGMDGTPDEATGHLQNRLTELGYDSGANDGRFGEKTKGAVAAFQKDHGLKEDGEVGATTKIALRGSDPDEVARSREGAGGVEVEDESQEADMDATSEDAPSLAGTVLTKGTGVADEEPDAAVSHLQKTIGAEADGRFGPETEKKLKATQRRYGLKADGVVGPKTGRLLDRMASKANPKKDEGEKKLDEAILERMEAGASGDTAAFTRARAKEKTLREASLRGFASDALREFYRLDDGTFAPKGRGKILKPGQQITLPHRAGSGKIAAKVEHVNGGRGLARISDGPDTGHLASVRATAPQGSRARPFPDPVKRLRDLPPGNPENPSQVAEVNAQNALDHINQAIAKGDDAAVQDYLDDMEANHAWADKNGHQPALSRYDMAKERGEHFLRTGEAPPAFQAAPVDTGEPVHKPGSFTQFSDGDLETMLKNTRAMGDQPEQADAMQRELDRRAGSQAAPIDFAGASDGQLDELIDSALDENGLPRSGRDRSIFHTALAEKKRRAKRAFETSRSDAAKEAASNSYAQVTGQRLTQEPAVQFAPPDDYVPNAGEKQMKEMGPGDTFYVGKHEEAYVWHKPTPGGPFIISKPVGGGKAKVFHQEFAPPFIGPSDPNGSPSTSAAPAPAPPATNEDDLYNALQSSLAKASAPKSSPARSSKGNLRNFKAMSDEKLMKLALEMKKHPDDVEAVKAITAELSSRADNTSSASAASVKKGDKVTHGDGILTHTVTKVEGDKATIKSPDNPSLGGGVESTVASSELKPAKTGNPGKVKLPKTHEPAKAKSKEEKIAAAWAAYDKKKADFDALPADTDKAMKAKAAAQMRAAKFRIKRVGGDLENRPDTGPVTVKSAPPKSAQTKDEKVPSPPDLDVDEEAQATEDAISVEAENLNLDAAGKELGEGWSGPTVNAALNKLETSGIVFDRENESPKTIAAVIKAAGFAPGDMKTTGTK